MKKILFPTVMLLISMLLISLLPTEAECAIYEDTIRLHILANSDEDFDQELKINIRDEVLKKYSKELSVFESIETAKLTLENKLSDIKEFTEEKIKEFGYSYPVSVSLSTE
jgi:stage II sporulation protein R